MSRSSLMATAPSGRASFACIAGQHQVCESQQGCGGCWCHGSRSGRSETSRAARRRGDKAAQRRLVLATIAASGDHGMTADEVEVVTGLPHQSGSARVSDLYREGLIVPLAGEKRTTRLGSPARVYVLTERSRAETRFR